MMVCMTLLLLQLVQDRAQEPIEQKQARRSAQERLSLPNGLAEPSPDAQSAAVETGAEYEHAGFLEIEADALGDEVIATISEEPSTRSVSRSNLRAASDDQLEDRPAGSGGLARLTKENAHEGDILALDKFYLPRPDWGRPNQGTAHLRDQQKHSLVASRRKHVAVHDLVVAKIDYGGSARQPVSIFKIIKLFQDRLRQQTWMRVRWYGEEQDIFLGKYYEKQEKLTKKMKSLMAKLKQQGVDVSEDVRFRITPDENIALTDQQGEQLVALVHWGSQNELLTKQRTLKENVVNLIRTDIRLQEAGIEALIEKAKAATRKTSNKRRHASASTGQAIASSSSELGIRNLNQKKQKRK